MIAHESNNFNVDINNYINKTLELDIKSLKCPNCSNCNCERHGYYKRYIIINEEKTNINILRVRCKSCGKTHAILPSFVVLYLHYPLTTLYSLLDAIDNNDHIDEEPYVKVKLKEIYKTWRKRLMSLSLSFKDSIKMLILKSSKYFMRCYAQLHKGYYYLISQSTYHDILLENHI